MKRWLLAIAVLCVATSAWAVGENTRRYDFYKNDGGLNDKSNPIAIDDDETPDCQNVVFDTDGAIVKRKGYSKFNSASIPGNEAITGLAYFRQSDGDDWLVATTTNSNVFTSTNVGGTFTRITGTASWTSGQNVLSSFDVAQDILVFDDGDSTTPPWKWNPDDTVKQARPLGGSPQNSTIVKYFKNHLFTASRSNSVLYFSENEAIETFDPGDGINVQTNDGSGITALWVQLDGLYIGKRSAIFRLDGNSRIDFSISKLVEGIGPINHQSVVVIDNVSYFLGANGHVYRYDGGITAERLSDRINATMAGLNTSRNLYATAGVRDREYWLSVSASGASTHTRVLVYDPTTDSWTKFKGITNNAWASAYDTSDVLQLYGGGYNGIVYKQRDTNADDGQAIDGYWQSKWHRFADLGVQKILRHAKVIPTVEGNWNLTMEVKSDFESSGSTRSINLSAGGSVWDTMVWDSGTWGGANVFVSDQPHLDKTAEFFSVKFSNSGASQPFTVRGYSLDVDPTGRR